MKHFTFKLTDSVENTRENLKWFTSSPDFKLPLKVSMEGHVFPFNEYREMNRSCLDWAIKNWELEVTMFHRHASQCKGCEHG